jgi:hypothetical protein
MPTQHSVARWATCIAVSCASSHSSLSIHTCGLNRSARMPSGVEIWGSTSRCKPAVSWRVSCSGANLKEAISKEEQ